MSAREAAEHHLRPMSNANLSLEYDPHADAVYVWLAAPSTAAHRTAPLDDARTVDYGAKAMVLAYSNKKPGKIGEFGLGLKTACSYLGGAFEIITATSGASRAVRVTVVGEYLRLSASNRRRRSTHCSAGEGPRRRPGRFGLT